MRWRLTARTTVSVAASLLCVIGSGAWVASRWWFVEYTWSNGFVALYGGEVEVWREKDWGTSRNACGLSMGANRQPASFTWRPSAGRKYHSSSAQWVTLVNAPLWPFMAGLAVSGYWLFGKRRRAGAGRCQDCGYDRCGLAADAKCPECGAGA